MILMLVPFVVLGIGMLLGGRPAALRDLPLRGVPVALAAFAGQWLVLHSGALLAPDGRVLLLAAAHAAIIAFLIGNQALPGARWLLAGALLNAAVILANGGFMPVAPDTLIAAHIACDPCTAGTLWPGSKDILLPAGQAVWPFLGDSIPLPGYVFSPGDGLLAVGLALLVWRGMRYVGATPVLPRDGAARPIAPAPAAGRAG